MPPNEPAPTAPFTDEDRARVEVLAGAFAVPGAGALDAERKQKMADSLTLLAALAHIDRLEGALREIAEIDWSEPPVDMPDELARAALDPAPTEQEEG